MRWIVLTTLFFTFNTNVRAESFLELLNKGRWAKAKLFLVQHKPHDHLVDYYGKHLSLTYLLNEIEFTKAYCDTLSTLPNLSTSTEGKAHYHLGLARYYAYHNLGEEAFKHSNEALLHAHASKQSELIAQAHIEYTKCVFTQKSKNSSLFSTRLQEANACNKLIQQISPHHNAIKVKCLQELAWIWLEEHMLHSKSVDAKNHWLNLLQLAKQNIIPQTEYHPQVIQNNLLEAQYYFRVDAIDQSIVLLEKSSGIMEKVNDNKRSIYLQFGMLINAYLSQAYEKKYNSSKNPAFIEKSILWEKQNLWLEEYKRRYEGFYYYRRFVNKLSIQTEQRLAFLFFKLYKRTGNNNYRNIALKYVEYFRNKPITQAGLNDQTYGVLQQMAVAEYNNTSIYEEKEDYTLNLITHHRYVSRFLAPTEAMIAYYCYNDPFADSIIIISQFIRAESDTIVERSYAKNELANLPDKIYEAVEHADLDAYKANAYKAYQLFLKPIINLQRKGINKLIIIPPAYYNKPLIFEGFLENLNGTGFENLTYVFNSINIIYENSFTHFIAHKNNKVKVNKVNIWNPDYSKTTLANITEGNKIVEHITKYYETFNVTSKEKSTLKDELLSGEILQVLAHADGKFDLTQRPVIYTALSGKDSVLYDYELETAKGKSALVVLAACKSNVGYLLHNGIVDGFTRAFITAGNGATIASIHNVEESATVELINLFYNELGKGKSTGEAFNAAKLQLKSAYPNPMVWQAFIYTGSDFYLIPVSTYKEIIVLGSFFIIYALIALMLIQTKF